MPETTPEAVTDTQAESQPVSGAEIPHLAEAAPEKRRPGRPKGSKTRRPVTLRADPPRCRTCAGTGLAPLRVVATCDHHGIDLAGRPFTRTIRRRVQCRTCGTVAILTVRQFDPLAWKGPTPATTELNGQAV